MSIIIISFLAGVLSVLAPCVLPVIPVIFGGSLSGSNKGKSIVIIISAMICIFLFTLLLKVSSLLIDIQSGVRTSISGVIIFLYGITLLFPHQRDRIQIMLPRFGGASPSKEGVLGDMILGASLGPIFASCSPTYALLLSTVLPTNLQLGLISMLAYCIGFGVFLFVLVSGGRQFIKKFYGVANNEGYFKKILGVILIITSVLILSGLMKKLEVWVAGQLPDIGIVEQRLIATTKEKSTDMQQGYQAPELLGLTNWINSSGYSNIASLKGKVVIIDFWTYSCVNCLRTLPYLQTWHQKYSNSGLVIIGVHAPEFSFEKKIDNLKKAVLELGLTYPIVQDNNFETRKSYRNQFWPAKYIIDQKGKVVYQHFGEGAYQETEEVIQSLLRVSTSITKVESKSAQLSKTPETYLGTDRRWDNKIVGVDKLIWAITGKWKEESEYIELESDQGQFDINVQAKEVNLVIEVNDTIEREAKILENGKVINSIKIAGSRLYNIIKYDTNGPHRISIQFDSPGIKLFALTFG